MAYVHPDGKPLDRLMRYLHQNGGRATRRELLSSGIADITLARATAEAKRMGLISTRMHDGSLLIEVRRDIAKPTPAEHRAALIREAKEALSAAQAKLAALARLGDE